MGKTLKQYVDGMRIKIRDLSDDSIFVDKFIEDEFVTARNAIVLRDFASNRRVNREFYQEIDCLAVKVKTVTCDGRENNIGESYAETPTLFGGIGDHDCLFFGDAARVLEFKRASFNQYVKNYAGMYSGTKKPIYVLLNNRAYFKNGPTRMAQYLSMVAVLADPREACNYDENSTFPIPAAYEERMNYIVRDVLYKSLGIPYDLNDNATDDRSVQPEQASKEES